MCPCLLLLSVLLLSFGDHTRAQLSSNSAAFNPLSGQGAPPGNYTNQNFPVGTRFALSKLVAVDETVYTFTIRAYWVLFWDDPRAAEMMLAPYDTCDFYCSSQPAFFTNEAGQPTCCDDVYIPQADAINVVGYDTQTLPYSYYIYPTSSTGVAYSTKFQGSFSTSFNYKAYPFDTHYLCIDVFTGFAPNISSMDDLGAVVIIDDGRVVDSQIKNTTNPIYLPGAYRPSIQDVNLAGWEVTRTWTDVLNYTYFVTSDARVLSSDQTIREYDVDNAGYTSTGIRIFIEVSRISRGFYIVVVILPIALIILFSFGVFSFSRESLKARINLLVTLFLTLIILQFVLQTILPGAFTLLSPFYLILVSYVYTFLLLVLTVVSNALYTQYKRREKHIRRRNAKQDFQKWKASLVLKGGAPSPAPAPAAADVEAQEAHSEEPGANASLKTTELSPLPQDKTLKRSPTSYRKQGIEDIDAATRLWYLNLKTCWYYKIPLFRNFAMWHKFVGQDNSQYYLEFCSHRLEYWARIILLLLYVGTCVTIFAVASSRSIEAASIHVLPN